MNTYHQGKTQDLRSHRRSGKLGPAEVVGVAGVGCQGQLRCMCVFSGDVRNDIYVTIQEGEFMRGSKTADKNVEVTMQVCNKRGEVLQVWPELHGR